MSNTTNKNVTLSKLGEFARSFADPANTTATISKAGLASAGVTETVSGLRDSAQTVYRAVTYLASLRESLGTQEDKTALMCAEATARKACNGWFKAFGSRPGRKASEGPRPLYSCTAADFVILGENCADARIAATTDGVTDWAKAEDHFLNALMLSTGRLILGKPLERLTSADFKAARKANNAAKAKKAEATKAENQAKADEQADKLQAQEDQITALTAELNQLKADAINVAPIVAAVQASHATQEEKDAIIAMLTGKKASPAKTSKTGKKAA